MRMLEPVATVQFDSWPRLFDWLPGASEAQLLTVFVWASDQAQAPAGERPQLERVRRTAFDDLVRRSRDRLRSYLVNRVGIRDPHLAEDIMQETFLLVYTRAEQFDPQRSYWGWLYRIAHNKHIDHVRRQRPGIIGSGQPEADLDSTLQRLAITTETPESAALQRERQERLTALIGRLPAVQRQIIQRKLDGGKGIDIAQELGKSPAYVSQAYHEALEVIRDQLGE